MGFIKKMGSLAGVIAGGVIGGGIELVGEITNSKFIKEVGEGVFNVSSKSGELIGNIAEGAIDTISGMITDDDDLKNKGKKQLGEAAEDTIIGVVNGVTNVTKKGINTAAAILDGDKEKAIECGKDLAKIALIGAFSISVLDIIDGVEDFDDFHTVDADVDHIYDTADVDDTVDIDNGDFEDVSIENPHTHSVSPHYRTLSDGREIWVDGDGDTTVDTGDGWIQHNPDYRTGRI